MPSGTFLEQILYAVKNGHIERAQRLLLDGSYDPSENECEILRWAVDMKLTTLVAILILDERIDVNCNQSICLKTACELGFVDIVDLFLKDRRADPSAENSICLFLACLNGHHDVVVLLLNDERASKISNHDGLTPLEAALSNEHYEIGRLLHVGEKLQCTPVASVIEEKIQRKGRFTKLRSTWGRFKELIHLKSTRSNPIY